MRQLLLTQCVFHGLQSYHLLHRIVPKLIEEQLHHRSRFDNPYRPCRLTIAPNSGGAGDTICRIRFDTEPACLITTRPASFPCKYYDCNHSHERDSAAIALATMFTFWIMVLLPREIR